MFGHLVQTKGIAPRLLNGLIESESGLLLGSIALRIYGSLVAVKAFRRYGLALLSACRCLQPLV